MKNLNIWFPTLSAGSGSDVYTRRLADALRRRGVSATITWFAHYYEFFPYLLRNTPTPPNIDIIHCSSWSGFAFKRKNLPLVITEHNSIFDCAFTQFLSPAQQLYHNIFIKPYVRKTYKVASAVCAVSDYTFRQVKKFSRHNNIVTIQNWYTPPQMNISSSVKTKNKFCVLFVGNHSKRKGSELLPQLAARLGSDTKILCIAGLRENCLIEKIDNIQFLPSMSTKELAEYYIQADVLISTSRYEGFGYTILEALTHGTPVVCFNNSALPELVIDGYNGFMVETDDIDAMVQRIKILKNDPKLRQKLAAGALASAGRYSEARLVEKYIDLYRSVI